MDASGNAIYGELEIGLSRIASGNYQIELRLTDPDSDAVIAPKTGGTAISVSTLLPLLNSADQFSVAITAGLFHDPKIREFYSTAKATFESSGRVLRIRLMIGPSAPELNALRWELLRDPDTNGSLATSERILFSRFMQSSDWRAVKLNAKSDLKALIAVSAPSDLHEKYGLAPVDLPGEVARAREGLSGIQSSVLGQDQPLTLLSLIDALRNGADILYLVCHGSFPRDLEPALFLQEESGRTARVKAGDLAAMIAELTQVPRLIVLASCESAGRDDMSAQSASLAPLLADAGVPAILAMQGKIGIETVKRMMPVFFKELLADGQIDRALAVARRAVRDRSDFWIPALFLRLRGGRIWYVPGFTGAKTQFEQWKSICRFVRSGQFVPLIGPDFAEHVYGTTRTLATELAVANGFPLAANDQSDLAKVAQYILTRTSPKDARGQILDALRQKLKQKATDLGIVLAKNATPPEILGVLASKMLLDELEPFRILADLGASMFVTADSGPLLEILLQSAGKSPVELVSHWRDERRDARRNEQRDSSPVKFSGDPVPSRPLIYYVFGKRKYEDTWVLTEDDFFDYVIRMSSYDLMPLEVSQALTAGSLLFLGFPLSDWKFRILLRMILAKGGSANLGDFNHVGVQIDPEEHTFADAVRAKTYLQKYFSKSSIDIYWGSSADFLRDLNKQLQAYDAEAPQPAMASAESW